VGALCDNETLEILGFLCLKSMRQTYGFSYPSGALAKPKSPATLFS
jgi:hypothetical protein